MSDRTTTNTLAGQLALVTGASRGIGYVIAKALAASGAHVIALARTVGGLEELDDDMPQHSTPAPSIGSTGARASR